MFLVDLHANTGTYDHLKKVSVITVVNRSGYYDQEPEYNCILPMFDASSGGELPLASFREVRTNTIDYAVLRTWLVHCHNHHSRTCE